MTQTQRPSRRTLAFIMAATLIVLACSSSGPAGATDTASAASPAARDAAVSHDEPAASGAARAADPWLEIELTDVASGETFTLASLAGQVVAIEPMAVWCSNCKVQQDNVNKAYPDIEAAGVRYISLGVDPNEDRDTLASYAERRGYPWTFARASTELARALRDIFGTQVLSPPSTPLIVLDANGEIVVQEYGFHGPDQLLAIFEEAGA